MARKYKCARFTYAVSALLFVSAMLPQWTLASRIHLDPAMLEMQSKLNSTAGVSCAKVESAEWLNEILGVGGLWPRIDSMVQKILKEDVTLNLQRGIPAWTGLKGIHFATLSLGDQPPVVHEVDVCSSRTGAMKLKMDLSFKSNLEIKLKAGLIELGLKDLVIAGTMIVRMGEFINEAPLVGGVSVYFADPPTIDWELTGLGGLTSIANLGAVQTIIRNVISGVLSGIMVTPNAICVPLGTELQGVNMARLKTPPPVGILMVEPLRAYRLPQTNRSLFGGKANADPYMRFKLADDQWESSVKKDKIDAKWKTGEAATFVVWSPYQKLQVEVWDQDLLTGDDLLGTFQDAVQDVLPFSNQLLQLSSDRDTEQSSIKLGLNMRCLGPGSGDSQVVLRIEVEKIRARYDKDGVPVAGTPVLLEAAFGKEDESGWLWSSSEWHDQLVKTTKPYTGRQRANLVPPPTALTMIKLQQRELTIEDIADITGFEASIVTQVLEQEAEALHDEAQGTVDVKETLWLPITGSTDGGSLKLTVKTNDDTELGESTLPYTSIPVASAHPQEIPSVKTPFFWMGGKGTSMYVSVTALTTGECSRL